MKYIIEEVHKIFCYIHLKQIINFLNFFPSISEMPKEIKFVLELNDEIINNKILPYFWNTKSCIALMLTINLEYFF